MTVIGTPGRLPLSVGARQINLTSPGLLKILRRTNSAIRDDGRWYVDRAVICRVSSRFERNVRGHESAASGAVRDAKQRKDDMARKLTLYHFTSPTNLQDILENGIQTSPQRQASATRHPAPEGPRGHERDRPSTHRAHCPRRHRPDAIARRDRGDGGLNESGTELAMSRGFGSMQQWLLTELKGHREPLSLDELHRDYLRWEEKPEHLSRSVRHSMLRALHKLESAGKVTHNEDGTWQPAGEWWARDEKEHARAKIAYHEAGHAVIGLAVQLPVSLARIKPDGSGYVATASTPSPVGYVYKKHGQRTKLDTKSKVTVLDAFGNPPRKREVTPEEHHAEVVMCIAGPMAHAKLLGDITDWREHASNGDMSIARYRRGKLGDAAKSWDRYAQDTAALINKHWPMVEAVAARLIKVAFLDAGEIDSICRRVVRRQHLRRARGP
jgi:hypothetical protein